MSKLVSGRIKKTPQTGITSDRYQFLGLEQAEPDLGDPQIGVSSVGANPHPPGDQYLLANVEGQTGKRYWIPVTQINLGIRDPGTFTVFNNDVQVGIANSFNVFNFVGAGVTVDYVGPNIEDQTGIATVRILVTDLLAPGNEYEIPYHDPITGFLKGSDGFVYRNGNVGIGSTIPVAKLNVVGNSIITGVTTLGTLKISSGVVTATSGIITYYGEFFGNVTGSASTASFATTAFNLTDASGILAGTISSSRLSGTYDINISGTAQNVVQIIDQVINASSLSVVGPSTFTGPVLFNDTVGIATTSSTVALTVESYGLKTGVGTFIASPGTEEIIDIIDTDTYDFKTIEYTFHFEYQNYIQSQKILVMQNKTSAFGQEYAIMYHPSKIVSLSANMQGNFCYILTVPETGISGLTTYRFVKGSLL